MVESSLMAEGGLSQATLTAGINIVLAAAVVLLAFVNWRVAARIKWLTGAMERHSDQQRQIAAKQAGVTMVWWDKTVGGVFPHEGEHNQVYQLETIYIGVPEAYRINRRWWQKMGAVVSRDSILVIPAIISAILGAGLWIVFKWVYPMHLDNMEWHGDVMGLAYLLIGVALGLAITLVASWQQKAHADRR